LGLLVSGLECKISNVACWLVVEVGSKAFAGETIRCMFVSGAFFWKLKEVVCVVDLALAVLPHLMA